MQTRTETITAPDGGTFDGYLALPTGGQGPGLLVLQEIFGVNEYIRDVCHRLAGAGYAAMAPDVFWRIERNVECGHDEEGMARAFGYSSRYDWDTGMSDLAAALGHLRKVPETGGRAGAIGFCFGGTAAFALGCVTDPDAVVSYYGSGVPQWLDRAGSARAPMLLHFGGNDPYIPAESIEQVQAWAAGRPQVEDEVYDSGHAFDNRFSATFSDPPAAEAAWAKTMAFLGRHLPT